METEIIPMYYATNSKGYSPEWIKTIKNSFAMITPNYTTKRMLDDYTRKFYNPLAERKAFVIKDNYAKAKEIAAWKEEVASKWNQIEIVSTSLSDKLSTNAEVGDRYTVEAVIDTKELKDKGIGVDFVTIFNAENNETLDDVKEMELYKSEGSKLYFRLEDRISRAGAYKYAFRMFPKNKDLAHRQDFCYVRWF